MLTNPSFQSKINRCFQRHSLHTFFYLHGKADHECDQQHQWASSDPLVWSSTGKIRARCVFPSPRVVLCLFQVHATDLAAFPGTVVAEGDENGLPAAFACQYLIFLLTLNWPAPGTTFRQ